ncbi:hypothetical protein JW921_08710 [Candidatus Fermentibacterales bacterium]|nr:hypothetical protein [Candidatus Fermentibacterales bacterium]
MIHLLVLLHLAMTASEAPDAPAFLADLEGAGIPASEVSLTAAAVCVTMDGSLSRGDSLLKHYGGVYYALLDSIGAGWPLLGLRISIEDVVLVLDGACVAQAIEQIVRGVPDEQVGLWVLEHTLLEDLPGPAQP